MIGSENTQLFEYADVSTAKMEFEALTGPGPGLVFFEKNEPALSEPISSNLKTYHSGRFILLYNGDNEAVQKALKAALGSPAKPR